MVVLVGGSGVVKKSTAILPAKRYLKHVGKPIIHGKNSVEAFLDQMDPQKSGHPQAAIIETELTNFISRATYMDPLIEVMIKLADAEDEFPFNTRGGGRILIPEPCLTVLSCSTPESLGERLPISAHGSGFMSRIIFVYARETNRIEDLSDVEDADLSPDATKKVAELELSLLKNISRIKQLAGPFTFTLDGRKWFQEFYQEWIKSPSGQGEGYPTRKPDHLLRVGMCFAAAKESLILDEAVLAAAKKILFLAEKDFDKAFAYIGTSYAKDRQRIVDFIASKAGQVTTQELYAQMYVYFKDLDTLKRTLALLSEAGVLKRTWTTTQPPVELWSLAGITFKI